MSAPNKSKWGVGSFLSQAVAGVEARLDNILAEEDTATPREQPSRPASAASKSTPAKSANDRLQERLARAVAAKNANAASAGTSRSDASPARQSADLSSANRSPRPSSDLSRVGSPAPATIPSPRTSISKDETPTAALVATDGAQKPQDTTTANAVVVERRSIDSLRPSTEEERSHVPESVPTTTPVTREETVQVSVLSSGKTVSSLDIYEKRIAELEKTLEEIQTQHQEELHNQVEQVDALQAKLQYLAREASETARKDVSSAAAGTLERKLAEKDQQVAQLMEEGNKLAGNEQKLRAVIKKLRTQITADEKELNVQNIWRQKAETELTNLRETVRSIDDHRKANNELQKTVGQLKRDLDRSNSTVSSRDAIISDLKAQLREESERAKAMEAKVNDQVRENNQRKVRELEDTIAAMQVEKNLAADKAKAAINEQREKAKSAAERTRAVELELKGEVQILESKLETLRAIAEEASSGAVGDAQAKLLRQIETLQTQYSIASDNWQGMEASLLARTASLEKERDQALRRESEMRKKAREAVSASRNVRQILIEADDCRPLASSARRKN